MKYLCVFLLLSFDVQAQSLLFDRLTRLRPDTPWHQTAAVRLQFPSFHPQGMVKIGPDFFMSSVEVTRPRQGNDGGEGIGHLFKFNAAGKLLAQVRLGEGALYHPGGIDFDGRFIWVPVAEYRPDSRSIVYKVDPVNMTVTEVLRFQDHIGAVVHDTEANVLFGVSWGSRNFYEWKSTEKMTDPLRVPNSAFYIDYQDCHYIGQHRMLCGGLRRYPTSDGSGFRLGGLEVVNLTDKRPVFQVPLLLWSPTGAPMTNNPLWVETTEAGLRAYFVPDDDARSTLFVYEAVVK